ncbi:hypothetical protein [Methylomonas sp. HYX-M1]|uniref:hypothetical protein n=1 Tax=Methylomonas sp. HYX-M1 TaxID=3139307 RepID=UPI00345B7D6C
MKTTNPHPWLAAFIGLLLVSLYALMVHLFQLFGLPSGTGFYSLPMIAFRAELTEIVICCIGVLLGALLIGQRWLAGFWVFSWNTLALPWITMALLENVAVAADFAVLFFLPIWLSVYLFIFQLLGIALNGAWHILRSERFNPTKRADWMIR